ncbi:hypothetical protein BASA81_003970 [Batrachochytrium salamandrivorans]|nr:hypothetical protein BASA81_003970 [Batrachochytrium salamandrivorans]
MADALVSRVLKPIITRALRRLLGSFFNLDSHAMKDFELNVVKGLVVLCNLTVLPVCLPGLELVGGVLGKLEMKIPWSNLSSEASKVCLSDLTLRFKLASSPQQVKLNKLRAAEFVSDTLQDEGAEDGEVEEEEEDEVEESRSRSSSTASEFSNRKRRGRFDVLMENVVVDCAKVRIEIEGDMGHVFVFTIGQAHLETTNGLGEPTVFKRTNSTEFMFRTGSLSNLALKLDNNALTQEISKVMVKTRETPHNRTVQVTVPSTVHLLRVTDNFQLVSAFVGSNAQIKRRLTLKQCGEKVIGHQRRQRGLWLAASMALRDRTRYLDLYANHKKSPQLAQLEQQLPVATVILFRRFAQELARRRKKKGFTVSLRKGLVRKKTSAQESQKLFEQIAADVEEASRLQWTLAMHSVQIQDYCQLMEISVNGDGITVDNIARAEWVRFESGEGDGAPVAVFTFANRELVLSAGQLDYRGVKLKVSGAVVSVTNRKLQLVGCELSNDANRTRFDCVVKTNPMASCTVTAVGAQGFDLDLVSLLPFGASDGVGRTFTSLFPKSLQLSCHVPLCLRMGRDIQVDAWQALNNNTTVGALRVLVDGQMVLEVSTGVAVALGKASVELLGATNVVWDKKRLARLIELLPPTSTGRESMLSLQSAGELHVRFMDPVVTGTEFVSLHCSSGFSLQGKTISLGDCSLTSLWMLSKPIQVFSTSGSVELVPNKYCTFSKACTAVFQQSFWLEVNDYLQTQVFALRPPSSLPFEMKVNASNGCTLSFFPVPFLPTLMEGRFELCCGSAGAEFGNAPAVHSLVKLSNCALTCLQSDGAVVQVCTDLGAIELAFTAFDLLLHPPVTLPQLEIGVRRHGPFPGPRSSLTQIKLLASSILAVLPPEVASKAWLVMQTALRDRRRVQPIVPAQAEDWHTMLYSPKPFREFVPLDGDEGDNYRPFRRFELMVLGAVEIGFEESQKDVCLPAGASFTTAIKYDAQAPHELIRLARLQIPDLQVANQDVRAIGVEVDRMSVGSGLDERFKVSVGDRVTVTAVANLLLLADRLPARKSTVTSPLAWAKLVCVRPFTLVAPLFSVSVTQEALYLRSRIAGESAFAAQASVTADTTLLLEPVLVQLDGMVAAGTVQRSMVVSPVKLNCTLRQLELLQSHLGRINKPRSTTTAIGSDLASTWVVSLAGFQLTLVAHAQPALQLFGSQVILRRVDTQYSMAMSPDAVSGQCGLGASYFNQPLARWEPLVEQISVSLELNRSPGGLRQSATIEVPGALCINVSAAAVDTISDLLGNGGAAATSSQEPLAAAAIKDAQWTFFNDSGEDVELEHGLVVRNGEQASLQLPCRTIHFTSKLFRALESIPSDVGYYVLPLCPAFSQHQARRTRLVPVSIEVFASPTNFGNFAIRLSSSVCVENLLDVPVELLLAPRIEDDEVIGKSALLGPIAPQTVLAIPIQCLDSRLCIRPHREKEQESVWWTGMGLVDLENDTLLHAQCGGDQAFAFHVRVKETSRGRFQLVCMPHVTVLNALPIALEFRLGANDRRVLQSGERGGLCTGDQATKLCFRVVGSAWSAPILLEGGHSGSITLEDASGKEISLVLECSPFHVYMVYARVWFRNLSDVDLAYRSSGEDNRLFTFGPPLVHLFEDPFQVGMRCECRMAGTEGEWVVGMVVNAYNKTELYDVVVEGEVKLTNVKRSRLRRLRDEYVMYNEPSGLVQVKLGQDPMAQWSTAFSVETGEGVLMLPGFKHVVALTVSIGSLYMFTNQRITVVTLISRHAVDNQLFMDDGGGDEGLLLCIRDEADSPSSECMVVGNQRRHPLHVSKPGVVRFSVERAADAALPTSTSLSRSGFCYSGAVDLSQPCEEAVKIQNKRTGEMWVLKVLVEWGEHNTLCVRVSRKNSPALYVVENLTKSQLVHYHQSYLVDVAHPRSTLVERLFPGESLEFGWDFVLQSDFREIEFVLIGANGKFGVQPDELNLSVYRSHGLRVKIKLEGITKRITVEDDNVEEDDVVTLSEAEEEEEEEVESAQETLQTLRCLVQSVVVSFVDSFPQELACLHVTELTLALTHTSYYALQVETKYLQVDNCLLNARLPVVLWPVRANSPHFFRFRANWNVNERVILCSLFTVSLELFDLFIDEKLLLLALRMYKECLESVQRVGPRSTSPASRSVQRIFVDKVHIDPVSFTVTVQTLVEPFAAWSFPKWKGPGTAKSTLEVEHNVLRLRISLTDIDRATVSLPAFHVERLFTTLSKFANSVKRKYHEQLLVNISRILSQEFMRIVNPIGGTIRVEENGSHLLHGAFNTLNAASKISGTIGTGAALLTLDSSFIASRRQMLIDEQPSGLGSGVLLAAKALSSGIVLGLAGIVYQPVMGASESGLAGFFTGLGKGLVGVGVRPVVGVFDMVSCLFSGARSATAWLDPSEAPRRARLPRAMGGASRALEPYDDRTALVQELVIQVWGVDRWRERGGDCDFVLLEQDCLVLIRVSDHLLVCIDFGDYAALLINAADKHISLSNFNATRPVLAWEIDGKACAESFHVERDGTVVVAITHFHSEWAGNGVVMGYGRAAGVVAWEDGRWVARLPTFSQQGREFLCNALERVMRTRRGGSPSALPASSFGLSTTGIEGKCVVSGVEPDSPAFQAGFQVGDVLVSFWGRKLTSVDGTGSALHDAIRELSIKADGAWLDVLVEQGQVKRKIIIRFPSVNF